MMQRALLTVAVATLVVACAETPTRFDVPPPRVASVPSSSRETAMPGVAAGQEGGDTSGATSQPGGSEGEGVARLAPPPRTTASMQMLDWSGRFPSNDSIAVSVDAMPLRDFIHYAFSDVLKASYVIAEGLAGLDEPVTLNLESPISSRAFYKLLAELLDSRKISTTFKDGVFYLHSNDGKANGSIPIGFGRRPQDVPDAPGMVMQVIPLRYGLNVAIERTILDLVSVQVKSDPQQSALFVTGEREKVLRALDVVALLDQPSNRSREVGIVSLNYVGARDVAEQLVTLLENEGIYAGVGRAEGKNVALVPLEQLGAMVVFAGSAELLQRVDYWTRQLDRPNQGPEERYFIYHPRHARASDLGDSLAPLLGGGAIAEAGNLARDTRSALGPGGAAVSGMDRPRDSVNAEEARVGGSNLPSGQFVTQENVLRRDTSRTKTEERPTSVQGAGITLSVDPRSNTLIFYTSGQRYQALLPMIRRLDVPPKQILLEAMIAEVTLSGEFAYGVEFAFSDGKVSGGTLGNLGLPDGGLALTYFDTVTNQVRLKLTATNNLVNILSNPTLVVRDGVEASIAVGNDVPTVGATASDPITSDRQITQVLYRKTGLDLRVRPTINAEGLVVMEIEQRISNTVEGAADVLGAPTFFERAVTTEVVARSGQSILLAGLISERQNDTTSRVPGISQIPGLGWLFRSDSKSNEKTELVVLLTPRVIDDPSEWGLIRSGMQSAFQHLRLPDEPVVAAQSSPAEPGLPAASAACADSDRDGICDEADRCARSLPGSRVDANGCEVGETVLRGITFGVGNSVLTPGDKLLLDSVVVLLRERTGVRAEIRGHTDDSGNSEANLKLSQDRAKAVRDYLIARGIDGGRLVAEGLGESRPIASNESEEGRAQNRRVTLEFLGPIR